MKKLGLALAAFILIGSNAFADGTTASQSSEASTSPSFVEKLSKHASLTYFGDFRGAGLNDPGNKFQPTVDGTLDTDNTQSLENVVTGGYKLDEDTIVGGNVHFYYSPVGNPTGGGKNFQWMDPALMISKANMIHRGNFSVKGLFFATLPSSQYDYLRQHGMAMSFSPTFSANYDVPNSNVSVGLYGYVTAYVPGANRAESYRNYKIYMAPNANWQFSKKVAATLWVDLVQATRQNTVDGSLFHGAHNADMDIEPGISWEFAKGWSVNPMVNIYPKTLTMAATSFQAVIAGKAL